MKKYLSLGSSSIALGLKKLKLRKSGIFDYAMIHNFDSIVSTFTDKPNADSDRLYNLITFPKSIHPLTKMLHKIKNTFLWNGDMIWLQEQPVSLVQLISSIKDFRTVKQNRLHIIFSNGIQETDLNEYLFDFIRLNTKVYIDKDNKMRYNPLDFNIDNYADWLKDNLENSYMTQELEKEMKIAEFYIINNLLPAIETYLVDNKEVDVFDIISEIRENFNKEYKEKTGYDDIFNLLDQFDLMDLLEKHLNATYTEHTSYTVSL